MTRNGSPNLEHSATVPCGLRLVADHLRGPDSNNQYQKIHEPTPLTFLGGVSDSIEMLPPACQTVSLFNPIGNIISGLRYGFFGSGEVSIGISPSALTGFVVATLAAIAGIVRSDYRLRT